METNEELILEFSRSLNNLKKSTITAYADKIRLFDRYTNTPFTEVTRNMVLDFIASLKSKQNTEGKNTTKNNYIVTLRVFFDYLAETGRINISPVTKIKSYKIKDNLMDEQTNSISEDKYLTSSEAERLINVLKDKVKKANKPKDKALAQRDMALYCIMIHRGFRIGEMLSMEFSQINYEKKILSVTSDKAKTGKYRPVALPDGLWNILMSYLDVRKDWFLI